MVVLLKPGSSTRAAFPDRSTLVTMASTASGFGAVPPGHPRAVERKALLERIERHRQTPLVVVTAPAGYGKTTCLLHLAARGGRSAYLRVTEGHDDPAVLIHDLAVALGTVVPLPDGLMRRLSDGSLEPGLQAASRLAEAIGDIDGTALLLLDDIHVLRDRRVVDALGIFIELLPSELRMVVAGHDASALRLGPARASGRVIEIGVADLAFGDEETQALAAALGLRLSAAEVTAINEQTLGWPVAIALALSSYSVSAGQDAQPSVIANRSVADYVRTELLDSLDTELRDWLLRSSVLDVMTGPLCDEALEVTGSLGSLRSLEHSSVLIQAVDARAVEYRYHPLLRDMLQIELETRMPGEAQRIAARAALSLHTRGESIAALEYARRSEDRDLMAKLMALNVWPLHWTGRIATLERWIDWFDRDGMRDRYAPVAVAAGFLYAIDGRRHRAELWLAAAEHTRDPGPMPDGSPPGAWVAILRGMMMPHGVDAVADDARIAEEGVRSDSPFLPGARLLAAVASWLAGDLDEATVRAREALDLAESRGAMPGLAMATGLDAVLALRGGNWPLAGAHIEQGLARLGAAGLLDYVLSCLVHAVAARLAVRAGSAAQARHHLAQVHRLRPLMTASVPWLSVLVRLEAIEALVALHDSASARTLMRETDEILRVRPGLGMLLAEADEARGRLQKLQEAGDTRWTLTAAELRVLQYLPTHLTFSEVAERLHVSPHTVKSQAMAIYGKLGVSSRRAAIETAVEVGLLDGSALRFPLGPGVSGGIG